MLGKTGAVPGCGSPKSVSGTNTQSLYVYVDDLDAHCERARAAGAKIIQEPDTRDYGDRVYAAFDLEGHQWWFGQRVDQAAWEAAVAEGQAES